LSGSSRHPPFPKSPFPPFARPTPSASPSERSFSRSIMLVRKKFLLSASRRPLRLGRPPFFPSPPLRGLPPLFLAHRQRFPFFFPEDRFSLSAFERIPLCKRDVPRYHEESPPLSNRRDFRLIPESVLPPPRMQGLGRPLSLSPPSVSKEQSTPYFFFSG